MCCGNANVVIAFYLDRSELTQKLFISIRKNQPVNNLRLRFSKLVIFVGALLGGMVCSFVVFPDVSFLSLDYGDY
jgi:hypothetical protein